MKSVLISIQPKWVEKIANGQKTIEVRKTAPKDVPFKCYIYCTYPKKPAYTLWLNRGTGNKFLADGKVIGEFICDKVDKIIPLQHTYYNYIGLPIARITEYGIWNDDLAQMCLKKKEIDNYGKGKMLYGWHISDLKIYDIPKTLVEFKTPPCEKGEKACANCKWLAKVNTLDVYECECYVEDGRPITRPPQSWQYVEE